MSFDLAAVVAIAPPRATVWQKRWRRWLPWQFLFYRLRDRLRRVAFTQALENFAHEELALSDLSISNVIRLVIPGWTQQNQHSVFRAVLFFATWIVLLLLSIITFGSYVSIVCFSLAAAVHALSIADVFISRSSSNYGPRVLASLISLVIVGMSYWEFTEQLRHYVVAVQSQATAAPFAPGDVLLYSPRAYQAVGPQVGDVVFCGPALQGARYAGQWVDRVIAIGPCRVTWHKRQLWINDQLSAHLPLNPDALPESLHLTVPENQICLFPTTAMNRSYATIGDWANLSVIQPGQIRGRVFLRSYPFSRWTWIQ